MGGYGGYVGGGGGFGGGNPMAMLGYRAGRTPLGYTNWQRQYGPAQQGGGGQVMGYPSNLGRASSMYTGPLAGMDGGGFPQAMTNRQTPGMWENTSARGSRFPGDVLQY
jgi:hypothetical protein